MASRAKGAQAATSRKVAKPTAKRTKAAPMARPPRAAGCRVLIASPSMTGAVTPAALPTKTSARAAAILKRSCGAPERITSRPRSASEPQKLNFASAGAISPAKRRVIPGCAKANSCSV
jgi:hypothetical protein